jgi:hypothetical protein
MPRRKDKDKNWAEGKGTFAAVGTQCGPHSPWIGTSGFCATRERMYIRAPTSPRVTFSRLSTMSTSAYYPPQAYGNYPQQYQGYAPQQQSAQYPAQYQQAGTATGQSQYPYSPNANSPVIKTSGSPPPEPPSAPDLAEVQDDVASRAMQRLISSELRHAGFDSAIPSALRRLELETVACQSLSNKRTAV